VEGKSSEQDMMGSVQPCSIHVENVWGPQVHGCGTDFDLTLLFQEAILSIGPLGIAILLGAWRIWQLAWREVVVASPLLYGVKIVSSSTCRLEGLFSSHCADDGASRASMWFRRLCSSRYYSSRYFFRQLGLGRRLQPRSWASSALWCFRSSPTTSILGRRELRPCCSFTWVIPFLRMCRVLAPYGICLAATCPSPLSSPFVVSASRCFLSLSKDEKRCGRAFGSLPQINKPISYRTLFSGGCYLCLVWGKRWQD